MDKFDSFRSYFAEQGTGGVSNALMPGRSASVGHLPSYETGSRGEKDSRHADVVFHLENRGNVERPVKTHDEHEGGDNPEDLGADHHVGNSRRTSMSQIDTVFSGDGSFIDPESRKRSGGGGDTPGNNGTGSGVGANTRSPNSHAMLRKVKPTTEKMNRMRAYLLNRYRLANDHQKRLQRAREQDAQSRQWIYGKRPGSAGGQHLDADGHDIRLDGPPQSNRKSLLILARRSETNIK
jgi:hypothetical protein